MSILTWPDYCVSTFRWKKEEQSAVFKSLFGAQALNISLPLWRVDLTGVPTLRDDSDRISLFLESISGFTNQIALWHLTRPVPQGTLRGDPVLGTDAVQGDITLTIQTTPGATLLAGDLIGFGSGVTQQVVKVTADVSTDSSGVMLVPIGTPLRNSFLEGTPVVWDHPKALFRQTAFNEGIIYEPKIGQPWTLSLIEDWNT